MKDRSDEVLRNCRDQEGNVSNCRRSQRRWNYRAVPILGVLIGLAIVLPTRAANDPKDMESQNANDAEVLQSTGQANLRIEIEAPKGTGGSEPDLALSYSSVLSDGPFGVGWQLELGEIRRTARYGTPAYDDSVDQFEFDGVLLVEDNTNPGEYRTVHDSFARITRTGTPNENDDQWLVEFPNGRKARFGKTKETQIRKGGSTDPDNDDGVIGRWLLSELEDAHGNITSFEYDRSIDVGTAYPKKISYTYRGTPPTLVGGTERKIEFTLENRDDPILGFPAGLETRIGKRVDEIQSLVGGAIYRRLDLNYAVVGDYTTTGRTRLLSAQLFGTDCPITEQDPTAPVNPENCKGLPAKTFTYSDTTPPIPNSTGAQWQNHTWAGDPSLSFTLQGGASRGVQIGDINGDGFPDFVQAWRKTADSGNKFEVYLGEGSGWGSQSAEWTAALTSLTVDAYQFKEIRIAERTCSVQPFAESRNVFFHFQDPFTATRIHPLIEARLMDLNADGFADIILSYETGAGSVSAATASICLGQPSPAYGWNGEQIAYVWINRGKAEADSPDDPDFGWEQRDDWSHDAYGQPILPPFYSIHLWTDEGTDSSDRPGYVLPPGDNRTGLVRNDDTWGTAAYYFDHGVRMPDLNGDGRPDIVAKRGPASFGTGAPVVEFPAGVWLSRANGVGWDYYDSTSPYLPPEPIVVEFGFRHDNPKFVQDADTGVRFADVNGDGLADIVKTAVDDPPPRTRISNISRLIKQCLKRVCG